MWEQLVDVMFLANLMRPVDGSVYGPQAEFNLQSEDFPALRGASVLNGGSGRASVTQSLSGESLSNPAMPSQNMPISVSAFFVSGCFFLV